jgi:hypothetical protein
VSGDITAQRYARDDARVLVQILDFLSCGGAPVIVFGGWAEELLGLAPPWRHRDIDLLLPAPSFAVVDRLLAEAMAPLSEIRLKRFAHKRACHFRGTMVELNLVNDDDGPITRYWGDIEFRWLAHWRRSAPRRMRSGLAPSRPWRTSSATEPCTKQRNLGDGGTQRL